MAIETQTALPAMLPIQRAAAAIGVSDKTIRRRIADGSLKSYRVGPRLIRVDRASLLALARPMGGAA
jgi:excisionase family DNA binding protein